MVAKNLKDLKVPENIFIRNDEEFDKQILTETQVNVQYKKQNLSWGSQMLQNHISHSENNI